MERIARHPVPTLCGVLAWIGASWGLLFVLTGSVRLDVAANLVETASPALATLACIGAARRHGIAWRWLAAACACWTAGSIVWTGYVVFAGDDVPFPSPADAGFFAFFLPACVGVLLLHEQTPKRADLVRMLLDAALVAGSLTVMLWFAILGAAHRADAPLASALSVGYVVGDIVVVSLAVSAFRRSTGRRHDLLALIVAMSLLAAGDALFAYQQPIGAYGWGWLPDLGWIAGFSVIGYAALVADPIRARGTNRRTSLSGGARSIALFGPYLCAVAISVLELLVHGSLGTAAGWTTIVLAFVAFARQVASQAERNELTRNLEHRLEDLTSSQARFFTVFDESFDPQALYVPGQGVVLASRRMLALLGCESIDGLRTLPFGTLVVDDDRDAVAALFARVRAAGGSESAVVRMSTPGGARHVELTLTNLLDHPAVEAVLVGCRDVSERVSIARTLEHHARHDPLTGLANRAKFLAELTEAVAAQGDRPSVAVAFVDLDRFKFVNDSLGHEHGDRLLCAVADRLRASSRADDLVSRLGGDEFTLLLRDVDDAETAVAVGRRIEALLREPFVVAASETFVSASVGVAFAGAVAEGTSPVDAAERLLRDADTAMYRAKEAGRARTELFDERRDRRTDRLGLANALHRALERDELQLYYQPVVDAATGQRRGHEALLRWVRGPEDIVPPAEFIHVAEDTGLIVPIGDWVLQTAFAQAERWHAGARAHGTPPLAISVNLSPRQFDAGDLVDRVAAALALTGIDPDLVWLEITESALMRDSANTVAVLRDLRALGVHLSVDDFGTGYSSLSYLKRFPVEALKIDRSFTDGLGIEPEDTAIVTAVIGLARALNLAAVAEGVETEAQLAHLRALGCTMVQGYLFGRPTPADASRAHSGA